MVRWQKILLSTLVPSVMLLGLGKFLDSDFPSVALPGVFYFLATRVVLFVALISYAISFWAARPKPNSDLM